MWGILEYASVSITIYDRKPYYPGNTSQNDDARNKNGGNLVGQSLNGCLCILRILDKLHDLVECCVLSNLLDLNN